ncbi:GNAT family N-acetyltransferase [Flavobacterium alkalisoli]|uniref:GNAT family N-acetyltransferase n=1 Tax=Flavobacterium alkalisoli TaxID=2602769 RepID=A0A5B9FLS7_9FLAO|nr:GNAT family N-acetyltransferase [Flavobacterium alkalisoli]QEE48193.1 GNAT family N-acetyltransferase [Flavobacterium alkalisoli]
MSPKLSYKIFTSAASLPQEWDTIAVKNIFLSKSYMQVLESSSPANMECHFVALYKNSILCGIGVVQYINLSRINTFGEEIKKKFSLKDYIFKKFSSHTLILGNNKLTGQNAYLLANTITENEALALFRKTLKKLKKEYLKKCVHINLVSVKDFNQTEFPDFKTAGFKNYYRFCTQPNMIFHIHPEWKDIEDYLTALNTKYRTQYNRARKKAEGVEKRKLTEEDILKHEERIHELYLTVASNAPFNTFFLPKGHFHTLKQQLKENFRFYGYFLNDQLVGFSTLVKNNHDMDTYFLGYDESVQKEKMLYLNMLYDMVAYAVKKDFKHVIFARSAMEIKSSVGARPEEVFGIIKHSNALVNTFMSRLFPYFDPKIEWKQRNPFK